MVIFKHPVADSEYYKVKYKKTQIVLHHTVSATPNIWDWFAKDGVHVCVAYVVDKNGDIYQLFNPEYWSYHLGRGCDINENRQSIGIEIVNEGYLNFNNKGFRWNDNKTPYTGPVTESFWRGQIFWAAYTMEQFNSVLALCKLLCGQFGIEKNVLKSREYESEAGNFKGILSHFHYRKDKTDVSPAFNLDFFSKQLIKE